MQRPTITAPSVDKLPVLLLDHPDERPANNFRLIRLCEWAGYAYSSFTHRAVGGQLPTARAALLMGPKAVDATGLSLPFAKCTGYITQYAGLHVIPTYSPGFIQRGNAKLSAPFINDLQKIVDLARNGMPPQFTQYVLDPSPLEAYRWAEEYRRRLASNPALRLAFDIETPGKGEDEDDVDTDSDAPDRTWNIERIGFSYAGLTALSVPWAPEYMAAIRLLMESDGEKVVWNAGFDVPRIRRAGVGVGGLTHDGMVAWHILHSDLPKRLGFVATFTCPWQPAWKHLSSAKPAFYNATDADVEWRSMESIESQLRKADLWSVYQRDVLDLEPILVHMQQAGMPVDAKIRLDRAVKLAAEIQRVKQVMEQAVPLAARKIAHVYKNTPNDTTDLLQRPGNREVLCCSRCGRERPRKDHFKAFKKKINECSGATAVLQTKAVTEYYRLADFTPSRDQLVRYHEHLGRPTPMVWDKQTRKRKVSFGEEQIRDLLLRYPDDILYPSILDYRGLDKLAGTYVGRPSEE